MKEKFYKRKSSIFLIITVFTLVFNSFLPVLLPKQNNYNSTPQIQGIEQDIYTKEWLDNPTFETPIDPWYNTTEGDISDINATTDPNQANYEVIGNKSTYEFYSDLTQDSNWNRVKNPNFPAYPDTAIINSSGASVSHYWAEEADQSVAVNWNRILKMPVNMSDYVIQSANLTAIFNASVQARDSWDEPGDDFTGAIDVLSDSGIDQDSGQPFQASTGDYVRFYVWISDIDNNTVSEVAWNQTWKLGQDSPLINQLDDTIMVTIPEIELIHDLKTVLSYNYKNFSISIGMRIWCEDNFAQDADYWKLLIIKSVNLTFTYEKNIDELTALSWNQVGNIIPHKIVGSTIDIINATLNFKYKIDKNWTDLSRNSEIRVYINNRIHSETVKLSTAKYGFYDIKSGGFDVKDIVSKFENITVTIQVYLADTFTLNETITLSITNASLLISYKESVIEETTTLDLLLDGINKTLEKSIEVIMGDPVNITAIYKNQTNFIQNALVQLGGLGAPKNFTENGSLEHYNITIHTSKLQIGNNFLTISASKKYYESIEISINIKVLERETDLQLFLDRTNKTLDRSIQMIYGNSGNLTITYKDKELDPIIHIAGASVNLTGLDGQEILNEDVLLEQYTIFIDTGDLGLGNTFLTINAQKENYTSQSIRFKIEVLERNSYIDKIFLNHTESLGIEIPWNETMNIAITFNDTATNSFIDNALVQLTGTGILENFTENTPFNYSLDINTGDLKLGINFLTISAQKENYTLASSIITISVLERSTYLEIYINKSLYLTSQFYNSSVGEYLNISVLYKDLNTGDLIDSALVQLIESGNTYNLTENIVFNSYDIIVEMEQLGAGVKFLTISAIKDNYTRSSEAISLIIREKETRLELFLDGTQFLDGETIELEVIDTLNITVKYLDNITSSFLSGATIDLIDSGQLDENPAQEYYNRTLNVFDLGGTLNRLSIIAQIENHQIALIEFFIQVIERKSEGTLLLNRINKTGDPYLELPMGSFVNVTIKFIDGKTGNHIPGADVQLDGDLTGDLIENSTFEQYSLIIDSTQLSIGVNILTIIAERPNFQLFTIQKMYINIRRINTSITTVSGNLTISKRPGDSVTLQIVLNNLDFGGTIKGASVSYRWQYGSEDLTDPDNDGIYIAVIEDLPEGTYIITIFAFLGDDYDFETYEIVLSVIKQPEEGAGFFIGLLIAISIGTAILTGYIIAYQRVYKFPKAVRKVRKYKKSLNRKSAPSVNIISREKAFKTLYKEEVEKAHKMKVGPMEPVSEIKKTVKKKPIETPKETPKETSKETTK